MYVKKGLLVYIMLTAVAVLLMASGSALAITVKDGGYVGTDVCLGCHDGSTAADKTSFKKSGHPWKYQHTGGVAPDMATAPSTSALADKRPLAQLAYLDGDAYQDTLLLADGEGYLDWSAINYTVGGFGWKMRWGIKDHLYTGGADTSYTGYLWTGPKHQYKLEDGLYQQVYSSTASPKKYSCAICHNTNGTSSSDAECTTALGSARSEPWASNPTLASTPSASHGGYYSEWTYNGVQCEACHGMGSDAPGTGGHAVTSAAGDAKVLVLDKTTGALESVAVYTAGQVPAGKAEICARCHIRSTNTTGPGGECGADANPLILSNGAPKGDAYYINHHEQYNEMMGLNNTGVHKDLACTSCHDPHKRTTNVVAAVAAAVNITDNGQSAEARGAVKSCESCHGEGTAVAASGGADKKVSGLRYNMGGVVKCIDCHMGEATKTTNIVKTGDWGRKGDLKTHIFKIDLVSAWSYTLNGDSKEVARNYITVGYACGKCHDSSMGLATGVSTALSEAQAKVYAADIHMVSIASNTAPTAASTGLGTSGYTVSFTDASTDTLTAQADLVVKVLWGDGSASTGVGGGAFSHLYTRAKKYTIKHIVTDAAGAISFENLGPVSVPERFTISGSVLESGASTTAISGAKVTLKRNGHAAAVKRTDSNGAFNFGSVIPKGDFTVHVYKTGYTFAAPVETIGALVSNETLTLRAQ